MDVPDRGKPDTIVILFLIISNATGCVISGATPRPGAAVRGGSSNVAEMAQISTATTMVAEMVAIFKAAL
jgi:hypothetical protein